MTTHHNNLDEAMHWFQFHNMTPASFVADLLQLDKYVLDVRDLFQKNSGRLLQGLNIYAGHEMSVAARTLVNDSYAQEILALSNIHTGLQFRASKASAAQVATFNLNDIRAKMCQCAPKLWDLLDSLLSADPNTLERRLKGGMVSTKRVRKFLRSQKALDIDGHNLVAAAAAAEIEEDATSEDEYWRDTALLTEAPVSVELHLERSKKLLDIVSPKLYSKLIVTYETNRKRLSF